MEITTKQQIIHQKVLNETTGELEVKTFIEQTKSTRMRGGFNFMYQKNYEQITVEAINSKTDLQVFHWVTNKFTYKQTEVAISYTDCSIDISRAAFMRLVQRLVDLGYLLRIRKGIYRLNPFVYLPFKANGTELQQEWVDIIAKQMSDSE